MRKAFKLDCRLRNAALFLAVLLPLQASAHISLGGVHIHVNGGGGGGGFGSVFKGLGQAFGFVNHVFFRITGHVIVNLPPPPIPVGAQPASEQPLSGPIEVSMEADLAPALNDRPLQDVPAGENQDLRVRGFLRSFYTLVGGPAWDARELVRQDGLVDPGQAVSDDIAAALARTYGVKDGAPAVTGPGLVMRVTTTHWEMKSVSINPLHLIYGMTHYGVYYQATFTLVDQRNSAVVASGDCDVSPEVKGAPTYSEAMANDGARLKDMLAADAAECAAGIEQDFLGIDPDSVQPVPPYPL